MGDIVFNLTRGHADDTLEKPRLMVRTVYMNKAKYVDPDQSPVNMGYLIGIEWATECATQKELKLLAKRFKGDTLPAANNDGQMMAEQFLKTIFGEFDISVSSAYHDGFWAGLNRDHCNERFKYSLEFWENFILGAVEVAESAKVTRAA